MTENAATADQAGLAGEPSVACIEPAAGSATAVGTECPFCADLPHPVATHCRGCCASWNRTTKTAHCATCHRTFTSPSAFDMHLLTRGCTDPAEVRTKAGERKFADPKPNKYGTLVWRGAGEWKPEETP